jgi:hypothetical protein
MKTRPSAFQLETCLNVRWLWCLTPLSTIFQLDRGRQCLLVEKTIDLSHNVVSSTPLPNGVRTRNVSGDRH